MEQTISLIILKMNKQKNVFTLYLFHYLTSRNPRILDVKQSKLFLNRHFIECCPLNSISLVNKVKALRSLSTIRTSV